MASSSLTKAAQLLFPNGLVGIIYDCDGVMIDSAAANRFLYNQILNALGLPSITDAQEKMAFQATFMQAVHALVPEELHPRLEKTIRSVVNYDQDIVPKIKLMPHFREFVEQAHAHGLKQAVDTNRTEAGAWKILKHFHLPAYFDPVMNAEAAEPKPSPDGALRICEKWDALPGQVLFVGDSPDDRSAAKGAGAIFAGFGGLDGDIEINSWPQLAAFLWEDGK